MLQACTFHGLDLLAYSMSEITSETVSTRHFGRTPCTWDGPNARPLLTQDRTKHKKAGIHPYLELGSNL
jgi:hypothetical protein